VASLSAAFVLRFYCPNGLRQVDLFANKFRRAERKRITLNPVTAGPGELGIWKAETAHAFAVRGSLYDFMPMMLQVCRGAI
jgi:hypothetical protein